MTKAYAIISIARQVDGEYCIVKVDGTYKDRDKARTVAEGLAKKYAETIQTASGPIQCVCERGVFELDIQD